MRGERWSKVKAIFDAALDYDTAERPLVVEQLADGDAELAEEVNSLLRTHRRQDTLLDVPERAADVAHPLRVGVYRVVRPVGNGGTGIVYEARRADDQFHQRVALKLLHPTAATKAALQRFVRERQVLASLEHPNLTRLIDGGVTSDGFPYLVMEYVDGEPLLAYCQRHGMGIRDRLDLFLTICETVEYAHSRLVVHRDIKPSNVLVDADGRPRLLDFGIAKLLDATPGEDLTATGLGAFTPAYASPEQIRSEVPAVSMDVYGLGVVLFELVSGRHPLGEAVSANEWVKRVLVGTPLRLSECAPAGLRQELKGDLEAICARAIEKEAVRRYSSVRALSDDIRAYLEGRPISVRKGQTAYVLRRFLRRNAVPVSAGLMVVASLSAALVMVNNESRRAERSYEAARRSLNAILAETARRDIPASTRRAMLATASEYVELLDEESKRDADAADERITIAFSLAGLFGEAFGSNLGEFARAEQIAREAIALAERAAVQFPRDPRFVRSQATGWMLLGDILMGRKKWDEALEAY
jgi:tRNA A-37 threonylcarbamoyl transferase component Bud32